MLQVGDKKISRVYVGSTPAKKVYVGNKLVWSDVRTMKLEEFTSTNSGGQKTYGWNFSSSSGAGGDFTLTKEIPGLPSYLSSVEKFTSTADLVADSTVRASIGGVSDLYPRGRVIPAGAVITPYLTGAEKLVTFSTV